MEAQNNYEIENENNRENNETFNYTYSAKQQEEIKRIRDKYVAPQEDKMEQLYRLDRSVMQKGSILSLVVGIIGILLMGVGMCCTMVWQEAAFVGGITWFVPGIIIGIIGIAIACAAYPLYSRIVKKEREKVAPQIIRLTDELMK